MNSITLHQCYNTTLVRKSAGGWCNCVVSFPSRLITCRRVGYEMNLDELKRSFTYHLCPEFQLARWVLISN